MRTAYNLVWEEVALQGLSKHTPLGILIIVQVLQCFVFK